MSADRVAGLAFIAIAACIVSSCAALGPAAQGIRTTIAPAIAARLGAGADVGPAKPDAAGDGCVPAAAITINEEHNTLEDGWGVPPRPISHWHQSDLATVRKAGFGALMPKGVDGLTLQAVISSPDEAVYYLGPKAVREDDTYLDFLARGGIQLAEHLGAGLPAAVQRILGDRATVVRIGDHDGTIVHADELQKGMRPYVVTFVWGGHSYEIRAAYDTPEEVIDLARSMVC